MDRRKISSEVKLETAFWNIGNIKKNPKQEEFYQYDRNLAVTVIEKKIGIDERSTFAINIPDYATGIRIMGKYPHQFIEYQVDAEE